MKTNHASLAVLRAAVLIALVWHAAVTWAADGYPPEYMTYQGFVADGNGEPLGNTNTGPKNYDVIFRIWNDASLNAVANRLWTEQQTVTIDKGYFSVLLGEGSSYLSEGRPALSTLFTNVLNASDRYIELTVKGIGTGGIDVPILPRLRLLTSPYAFLARNAISAQNIVNSVNNPIISITGTNVGISKSSPGSALDVNGTVTAGVLKSGTIHNSGTAYANTLTVSNTATVTGTITAGGFSGSGASLTALNASQLTSGTVADARLSSNVPKLNASAQTFTGSNWFNGYMFFGAATRQMLNLWNADYGIGIQSSTLYNRSGGNFAWFKGGQHAATAFDPGANGTCLMVLNSSGNLGVGTSNPYRLLQVGDINIANSQGMIRLASRSGTGGSLRAWDIGVPETDDNLTGTGYSFVIDDTGLGSTPEFMIKYGSGNVGIGTTNPAVKLHVIGQVKISDLPIIGDEYNVQWDGGNHTLGRYASSRRYKENIRPMEADWFALLRAQPVSFTFIGRPDRLDYGLIAEDLDALGLKPLVIYDEIGRPDSIRYEKISLYLLQLVKAQQEELQEKTVRLEALEQSVAELKALVNGLAEKVNAAGK